MEKFNGEKIPLCVKELLMKCAYDTLSSLLQINPNTLRNIESFLNNHKMFITQLKCCYHEHYKSLDIFEFLPGHKEIILAIPSQIQQMKQMKSKRNVQSKYKSTPSDSDLKSSLVTKLTKYAQNIGLELPDESITEMNLTEYVRGSEGDPFICQCRFICPICAKNMLVSYVSYWKSSNITTHIKDHLIEEEAGM